MECPMRSDVATATRHPARRRDDDHVSVFDRLKTKSMRFRIEFEAFSGPNAAQIRMQGFLPFALRALPDVEHPSFRYAFGVYYANVDLQYDALRSELREPLDRAVIRWAVAQLEDRLRLGRFPESRPDVQTSRKIYTDRA